MKLELVCIDLLILTAAAAASVLSSPAAGFEELDLARVTTFSIAVFALLTLGGAYRKRTTLDFPNDVRIVLSATAVAALSVIFVDVLFTDTAEAGR